MANQNNTNQNLKTATFAGGCFWCTEAIFKRVKGVKSVISGYTGGSIPNPTYEQVTTGTTGHAEAVNITYDPEVISYKQLLDIFWATHDPTSLNRQGADIGSQYRSAIFYHDQEQKNQAKESKEYLESIGKYTDPIVTTLEPFTSFYPAEDYHQNYYDAQGAVNSYCAIVIDPKVKKLLTTHKDRVKEEYK